ncbi:MAG: hypothetical protein MIO92_01450 [Methanosarcinaceae archaeon]|nr:hypothetical protein [Methanosarcinaceae archaeon]
MHEMNPFLEKIWRYGRPADLWIKNIENIKDFITKNNLKPILAEHLPMPQNMADLQQKTTSERMIFKPIPFPGGIRLAHFHFQDNIYILNAEQWKDFSGRLMKDFQAKLATVKTIGFERAIELSSAIDSLP